MVACYHSGMEAVLSFKQERGETYPMKFYYTEKTSSLYIYFNITRDAEAELHLHRILLNGHCFSFSPSLPPPPLMLDLSVKILEIIFLNKQGTEWG